MQDVLGSELIGAYLYGSAVLGGLRAQIDVDVLAVAARRMTSHEKRRMAAHLLGQ
jgi:predicted nucleotidyltransferase